MRPLSPRILFSFKYDSSDDIEAPRAGLMPSAHIDGLAVEFIVLGRKFSMEEITRCDWSKFDELSTISRLEKIVICLQTDDIEKFQADVIPKLSTLQQSGKLKLARPWLVDSPFWCLDELPEGTDSMRTITPRHLKLLNHVLASQSS